MDSIDKMTVMDLRLSIAVDMGWEEINHTKYGLTGTAPGGTQYVRLPNWTTSISDAFDLVNEMAELEHVSVESCNGTWECTTDNFVRTIYGRGDTAPLAICRAYLAWKTQG